MAKQHLVLGKLSQVRLMLSCFLAADFILRLSTLSFALFYPLSFGKKFILRPIHAETA
jgi:hypothetical protein